MDPNAHESFPPVRMASANGVVCGAQCGERDRLDAHAHPDVPGPREVLVRQAPDEVHVVAERRVEQLNPHVAAEPHGVTRPSDEHSRQVAAVAQRIELAP
jgi:hypothetical protein